MMRKPITLTLFALLMPVALPIAGAARKQAAPLPRSEAVKLRKAFGDALALPGEKGRSKLRSMGATLHKKYRFDDLLEALRRGPYLDRKSRAPRKRGRKREEFEEFGNVLSGLTVEHDGDLYRYAVDVPRKYDPKRPAPVLLDPGHGVAKMEDAKGKAGYLGYFRNMANAAGMKDALVIRTEIIEEIGGGGRRGQKPEDQVVPVFDALFRDVASRFAIDPDQVYVSGLSQTGFWAWYLGISGPDRFAGSAPMGAVTFQVRGYDRNLARLPLYVIHGDNDDTCDVAQPRETCARLGQLDHVIEYQEVKDGLHDFTTWQYLGKGLRWLREKGGRNAYPKTVGKSLQTELTPWCYWIRVDSLKRKGSGKAGGQPTAWISGEIEGQSVRIRSEGVRSARLCLSRELLQLDQEIEVSWNGKAVFQGKVERSFAKTLEIAWEKADWRGTFEAALDLKAPR